MVATHFSPRKGKQELEFCLHGLHAFILSFGYDAVYFPNSMQLPPLICNTIKYKGMSI